MFSVLRVWGSGLSFSFNATGLVWKIGFMKWELPGISCALRCFNKLESLTMYYVGAHLTQWQCKFFLALRSIHTVLSIFKVRSSGLSQFFDTKCLVLKVGFKKWELPGIGCILHHFNKIETLVIRSKINIQSCG